MTTTLKTISGTILAAGTLLFTAVSWGDEVVPVASLEVKDRIRTIDQINVSAETEKIAEAPSSEAVAQLLEEARELDAEADVDATE
jgi:hypothetical protein